MIRIAAVLGFLSVALGAMGAHYVSLTPEAEAWWQTASHYLGVHSVLLAALALARGSGWRFARGQFAVLIAGVLIFSGCLYAMALTGVRILGAVVPIGGGLLLAGWAMLLTARVHPCKASSDGV